MPTELTVGVAAALTIRFTRDLRTLGISDFDFTAPCAPTEAKDAIVSAVEGCEGYGLDNWRGDGG